jgi:Cu(I)/Ag(I) efflux system membrane protein CusA/SilA
MQRIAVPMIGGMVSSALLTLIVIPAVYGLVKGWQLQPGSAADGAAIKAGPADLKTAAE